MNLSNKSRWSLSVFAALAVVLFSGTSFAQKVFYEADGIVTMELESTDSPLGKWVKVKTPAGYLGECALEFMGNAPAGGAANSPLVLKFHITTAGIYKQALRCHKRLMGAAGDLCNDCYFKVDGDYTAGGTAPLAFLKSNGKLYAYGLTVTTWDYQYPFDHAGGTVYYNFKAGQVYTVTISGRSQRFNIDRVCFFKCIVPLNAADSVIFKADSARGCDPKLPESPTSPVSIIKTSQAHYLAPVVGNTADIYSLTGQYFGKFPISKTGKVITEGKIGTANYITVMPGNISKKVIVTKR